MTVPAARVGAVEGVLKERHGILHGTVRHIVEPTVTRMIDGFPLEEVGRVAVPGVRLKAVEVLQRFRLDREAVEAVAKLDEAINSRQRGSLGAGPTGDL